MSSWPSVVFQTPLLRGLDARGKTELSAAGRLFDVSEGQTVYRAGQTGQMLYVVVDGAIALSGAARNQATLREHRRVARGESFGEEAAIGASWRMTATALSVGSLAEIPVAMLRRTLERAGGDEQAKRMDRRLFRRAAAELLAATSFTADLDEADRDMLLDAAERRSVARGETVYRTGEPASDLWIVADGMVQLQTEDDDRIRVRAYLLRGDFFGDEEALRGEPRRETAVASGPGLLIGIAADVARTVADRNPGLMARLRRVTHAQLGEQREVIGGRASNQTQHAFRDLYRLQVARSLLVIDLDSCVRCGHCAASCESLHGQARLIRRGDTVVTSIAGREASPLLLPTSCQHCENPACMVDCPTGAIGRDPRGEVFIREPLCTGCGACVKACPWDNIDLIARPAGSLHEAVAVKCDLCRGYQAPACVESCPTEAILRIDPRDDIPEVAQALRRHASMEDGPGTRAARALWGGLGGAAWWGAGGGALALALVGAELHARGALRSDRGVGWAVGVATVALWLVLLAYSLPKRAVRWRARRSERGDDGDSSPRARSKVRPHLMLHFALGLAATATLAFHGGARFTGSGGAAAIGLGLTALFGIATVIGYGLIPARLSRLERRALLPEEIAPRYQELYQQLYAGVTGKSELVKKLFERVLVPYLRVPLGWFWLIACGGDLKSEEQRLRGSIDAKLQGRGAERLAGLDGLIRSAVELRALAAQRWLGWLLRAALPAHVIAAIATTVLIAVHVATAVRP